MQQFSKFTIGLAVGLSSFYGACTLYGDAQAAYAAYQEGLRVQQYMATHARPIFPANLELHNEHLISSSPNQHGNEQSGL